jgi:transaldolase
MRPQGLNTRIFLDGGDPGETQKLIGLLGFLDGQTTNPTLISKNPLAKKRLERGEKFTEDEILGFYQGVVKEISSLLPLGSISIEVYSDNRTTVEEMLAQGKEMYKWIPNAHIKFPTTHEGITAAEQAVNKGMRVNMTLCFRQQQAAAVYKATLRANKGDVFVSPFIGRLDDRGEDGMDLIANIIRMYKKGDGHVEVLTASVRKLSHLLYAISLGSDIVTAPFKVLNEWGEMGIPLPGPDYVYDSGGLKEIPYLDIDLVRPWQEHDITHELTDQGIKRFSEDWNSLITI